MQLFLYAFAVGLVITGGVIYIADGKPETDKHATRRDLVLAVILLAILGSLQFGAIAGWVVKNVH